MAAAAAIAEMKAAMDTLMKANLAPAKPDGQPLSQLEQESLAEKVVESVKKLDNIFEQAKLAEKTETADGVEEDIEEMRQMLAQKEALLRKSMEKVEQWEGRFSALREGQKPLLFES